MKDCIDGRKYGEPNKDGYISINPNNNLGHSKLHRKVYALANNYSFDHGDVVRHTCDTPWCINENHLVLGTQADNVKDSVERGRHKNPSFKGTTNPMARLTEDEVIEIRDLFADGWTHSQLAEEFNIHRITALNIVNRKTWKHIPERSTTSEGSGQNS